MISIAVLLLLSAPSQTINGRVTIGGKLVTGATGASVGLHLSTLSNGQLASMTNGQLAALVN